MNNARSIVSDRDLKRILLRPWGCVDCLWQVSTGRQEICELIPGAVMILEYNATDGPEMNAKTWPLGHRIVPEASGRRPPATLSAGQDPHHPDWRRDTRTRGGMAAKWCQEKIKSPTWLSLSWYHGKCLGIRLRREAQIIQHMVETRGSRLQTGDWGASKRTRVMV